MNNPANSRPPVAIIASDHEWSSRSIKSILASNGYAVLITYTGRQTLEQALSAEADLILIDHGLPDMTGPEVCRALRRDPRVSASTPILMTSAGKTSRAERLEALAAGAWDFVAQPFDAEELLFRLASYVRAKLDSDRLTEEGMVDPVTGLYNLRGLMRRARELGSDAYRHGRALACVAIAPQLNNGDAPGKTDDAALWLAVSRMAKVLQESGRVSDAIGRVRMGEFVIIASSTDASKALKLAQRLQSAAESAANEGDAGALSVLAGYDAVPDFRTAGVQPAALLAGATAALRQSQQDPNGLAIHRYEGQRDKTQSLNSNL
jgi:two-component system chemotaxis response regulator CheY